MIVLRVVLLPFKVGTKTGVVASKAGYRTARLVGYRRLFVLAVGIGIGLLVAPTTGRQLREKLMTRLAGAGAGRLPDPERRAGSWPEMPSDEDLLVVSGTNGHA
jgi:hypothetical protein